MLRQLEADETIPPPNYTKEETEASTPLEQLIWMYYRRYTLEKTFKKLNN